MQESFEPHPLAPDLFLQFSAKTVPSCAIQVTSVVQGEDDALPKCCAGTGSETEPLQKKKDIRPDGWRKEKD